MTDRTATELYVDIVGFHETCDELTLIFDEMFGAVKRAKHNTHLVDLSALAQAEHHAAQLVLHLRRIIKTQ